MPSYSVKLTAKQNKDLLKYLTKNDIEMSPEVFIQHLVAAMTDDCAMDEYELDDSDLDTAGIMRHRVFTDKKHDDAMMAIYNSWKTTAGTEPLHSPSEKYRLAMIANHAAPNTDSACYLAQDIAYRYATTDEESKWIGQSLCNLFITHEYGLCWSHRHNEVCVLCFREFPDLSSKEKGDESDGS